MARMHVFFSVGEPSGDQHAAHLMQDLRRKVPGIRFSGFGGPRMTAVGFEKLFHLTDLAVMGVFAVLPLIWKFYRLYREARAFLREQRPDLVVLVDFSGFNWWIAHAAKANGIRVVYYCPPQIWAWGWWRTRKMRRLVDHVLSVLPFEAEWYRQRRVSVEYVGHPFFDAAAQHPLDDRFCADIRESAPRVVGVLPGSRGKEVTGNFPQMLEVIRRIHVKHPHVRFPVACYKESQLEYCRSLLAGDYAHLPVDLHLGRTPEIIASVDCCLMVSGSVSLEVLFRGKPAIVTYRIGTWTRRCKPYFITVNYFSLPNLMAGREVMPEFLLERGAESAIEEITRRLDTWLAERETLDAARREMEDLRAKNASLGGLERAADALVAQLELVRTLKSVPAQSPSRAAA